MTPGHLRRGLAARVRASLPYAVAREVKGALGHALADLREPTSRVVTLRPPGAKRGDVLLSYRLEPFLLPADHPLLIRHTAFWRSAEIAKVFLELGYGVDVISPRNSRFSPRKRYAAVLDTRRVLERIAPTLEPDCVRIVWLDMAHVLYHNAAESRRLLALQRRTGVSLSPQRFTIPGLGIEHADTGMTSGNDFTIGTFRYAGKPIHRLPIICPPAPWPEGKDWEGCRRRFVWFGSQGFLHKGLDLVLEVFATMPAYHLTVCGPLDEEREFVRAFHRQLFETPNIETVGWVDMESERFLQIARGSVAVIHPSCSEAGSTSTMYCMHAGLIPIVTYEAGVDVDDFGVVLKGDAVDDVREAVVRVSEMPAVELQERARDAWAYARANHTRERFVVEYRRAVESILAWSEGGRRTPAPGVTAPAAEWRHGGPGRETSPRDSGP